MNKSYLEFALLNTIFIYIISGCYHLGVVASVVFATVMVFLMLIFYLAWFKFLRKGAVFIYEKIKNQLEKWQKAFKKVED